MKMCAKTAAVIGLFFLGLLGVAVFSLHRDNAKLQAQAGGLRQRNAPPARGVGEGQLPSELLVRAATHANDAVLAVHQDVVRLRPEVREREEHARAVAAQKAADAAALAANRDPERALTPLENFQNVGRGSPTAAVQTLVWAALKADDAVLLDSLALADDAREKALQLLARLPESARTKYPGPESLAALVITNEILRVDAVQIVASTPVDARHALVRVRLAGVEGEEKIFTELVPDGWRVTVPKSMMVGLEKRLKPPPRLSAAKK